MTEEQHIQKGFNAGYQLQKQNPELAQSLGQAIQDKNHPYAKGFSAGKEQFNKEQSTQIHLEKDDYLKELKQKAKEQLKGKEPDDPEMALDN